MDKILVADQNPKNSELICQCLLQKGYQVITAANGYQIIAKSQLFRPDLIILDTHFDDMSGFDICRKIKSLPEGRYTLILFICSLETKDSKIKAFESGADDIMEKTFDSLVLSAKVTSLLRINTLRNELHEKYTELEEKNNKLDFQLKMSQQIQRSIMRDYDMNFNGVRLLTYYLPALDIGGDFYDLLVLNEDTIGLCIGDVSGHGISAALLTTMISTMIRNTSDKYRNPDQLLFSINNQFCNVFEGSNIEIYSCLFCAVIDTKNRKLYYSNAGQPYPFYLINDKCEVTELAAAGMPIGMMRNTTYENKVLNYEKNDILIFYTDGLSDTFYKDSPGEFQSRMKELLLDAQITKELGTVKQQITDMFCDLNATTTTRKFGLDDVSLILCRFEN